MDNLDNNIMDVVAMSDLNPVLSGVDMDTEAALLNYIKKTRDIIAEKPDMFLRQQDAEQMLQMFDYLLANWATNRIQAIKVLADKETELLKQGYIKYDTSDLSISDVAETDGFFNALAELFEDEISQLDGLFSRLKEKIEKRKEENKGKSFKEKFKGFISKANKFNPVTLAVRNALRGLFALNFLGISSIITANEPRSKEVLAKVKNMYKNMGGKEDKLMQTLNKAKNRKALFNKKAQHDLEAGKFKGVEGLGSVTIASLLTAAGAFILKIWDWIKKAGIKTGDFVKKAVVGDGEKDNTDFNYPRPDEKHSNESYPDNNSNISLPGKNLPGKTNDNSNVYNAANDNKKTNWKPILITVGVLGLVGGGLVMLNNNNKKKQEEVSAIKASTKLQGITLK